MGSGASSNSRRNVHDTSSISTPVNDYRDQETPRRSISIDTSDAALSPVGNPEVDNEQNVNQFFQQMTPSLVITPSREMQMRISVCETPHGEQAVQYPYYCPLCMEHFADVLVASCCGNYNCIDCVVDYIATRNVGIDSAIPINEVLAHLKEYNDTNSAPISCPQCLQVGYCPKKVVLGCKVSKCLHCFDGLTYSLILYASCI